MSSKPIIQNPFDFSNPVTDRSVLAGREEELQQASYYLDQSREGAAYSLALVGERASGKTSLLNALADYAEATGLIAAHVRLDEGVTANELDFFREVFHGLIEACAKKGVFGGEAGPEYDAFCRQILLHDLGVKREHQPLNFGSVYATARAEGRDIALSRRMLLSDLGVIVNRCRADGFPAVVLLIDEGDLLAGDHALLQNIRNLLMDSRHFSLIAAGTEKMFPAISDVFSPVPRQFVRINVGPFRAWEDTRKAILRRLTLAGQEWAMPDVERCREIHSLTRGSPYEVMLVSHFAYRELTRRRQRVPMSITPEVIGAVADQLAQQNPSVQETLTKLNELERVDAETVRELLDLDGISVDRFALAKLDFSKTYDGNAFSNARDQISDTIDRLRVTGFVSQVDGVVHVDADSFQRALIKYVVLGHRDEQMVEPLLSDPERQIANKALHAMRAGLTESLGAGEPDELIAELLRGNASLSLNLALNDKYLVSDYPVQALCRFNAGDRWTGVFVFKRSDDSPEFRAKVKEVLVDEANRLKEYDIEVSEIKVENVRPEAIEAFRGTLAEGEDPLEDLILEAREAFSEGKPDFKARVTAACSAMLENDSSEDGERWQQLNDCAFMALGSGDGDSYKLLSDRAGELEDVPVISRVTRGLWEAIQGDFDVALKRLEVSEEEIAALPDEYRGDLLMYSPAVLAGDSPSVAYDDLVGGVEIIEVIHGYRAAINALQRDQSVADALGDLSSPSPWLIGAAADAAESEGRAEFAIELRRRAAQGIED